MSVAHAVGSPEPGRPRPTALVVLVNWRQPALTVRAARSVQDQLARGDRLVVVDNGSTDGSPELVRGDVNDEVIDLEPGVGSSMIL